MALPSHHPDPAQKPKSISRSCGECGGSITDIFCRACNHSFESGHKHPCSKRALARIHDDHPKDETKRRKITFA